MSRRRSEQVTPLFPNAGAAAAVPEAVPPGHPLKFWDLGEAAENTKLSESFLQASPCPRVKIGARVLFDPIETVLWVRRHLTNRPNATR